MDALNYYHKQKSAVAAENRGGGTTLTNVRKHENEWSIKTGVTNRHLTTIEWNNATRTFTIAPTINEGTLIFIDNERFLLSVPKSVTISNTSGGWFIYFTPQGILEASQSQPYVNEVALVAYLYWNASTGKGFLSDERHTVFMPWQTHVFFHNALHTQHITGLDSVVVPGVSGWHLNEGANDALNKGALSDGIIMDEDINISIIHADTPSEDFEAYLHYPAKIPVFYLQGANLWQADTPDVWWLKYTPGGNANWNEKDGITGLWKQTQAGNAQYVAYFICATSMVDYPVISIQGQRTSTTLAQAQTNATIDNLLFYGYFCNELRPLYRIIFQTGVAYTTTPKIKIIEILDIRKTVYHVGINIFGDEVV